MFDRYGNSSLSSGEGHIPVLFGEVGAPVGAVMLAFGAANDNDPTVIIGGIVMADASFGRAFINHTPAKDLIHGRYDKLEDDD